ncbi:SRPBCC family protein [Nocardia amikacinitolerans]|uniref:Polyketide cyclase / dehydrase and lipid transport n=1 Tax=Nocardia amikacinitolerans TaxID=756689 RepID=A0A285LUD5_9NOCA|nr:SRPBCC family protein [Nocardia amikacinitolerans]MCP2289193.1 Polyketide cyclase / dehydrase and lipid transport [Nocardia amikacinitolerans]MCP2295489.1 Polyketide cyclase / dehydrase and lipid transport [Nocardia amikacinitolerans]MCP2318928.1 Polyketide cyclase / dehydrase and lipid transport [Nocardia amikacinitolerans]SNY88073.1 Polyketide cyclase / dehydrase and lipid transport [Nocardia amikacinitolerans]
MGHIEATKDVNATPEALWAVVSDPQTWDKWFTIHERFMEEPPTVLAEGSKLVAKIVMLGMANKLEWTIKAVEAPNKLTLGGTGMAGVKTEFTFDIQPKGAGSTIVVSGDFEGALIKGALGKAVEKDGIKQLDKSLEQLDALASA